MISASALPSSHCRHVLHAETNARDDLSRSIESAKLSFGSFFERNISQKPTRSLHFRLPCRLVSRNSANPKAIMLDFGSIDKTPIAASHTSKYVGNFTELQGVRQAVNLLSACPKTRFGKFLAPLIRGVCMSLDIALILIWFAVGLGFVLGALWKSQFVGGDE